MGSLQRGGVAPGRRSAPYSIAPIGHLVGTTPNAGPARGPRLWLSAPIGPSGDVPRRRGGSVTGMPGPLALVGSGEFLEVMRAVDIRLLESRPGRAVILPTAAAEDGAARVDYWLDLGSQHFAGLGVTPVPLRVLDRADAERSELAEQIAGAGLVYLSGGNPGYLADTLRGTAVWRAVLEAWEAGAALAGCSAGACALSAVADDFRHPGRFSGAGLGVVADVVAIPHFDRFSQFMPNLASDLLESSGDDLTVLGIDEETALVGGPTRWTVAGRQAVWRLERDGTSTRYRAGDLLDLAPPAIVSKAH